ncbi:MAG: hypothetical protein AAFY20_12860 [Cyanobacteria bacterium J06639_14]
MINISKTDLLSSIQNFEPDSNDLYNLDPIIPGENFTGLDSTGLEIAKADVLLVDETAITVTTGNSSNVGVSVTKVFPDASLVASQNIDAGQSVDELMGVSESDPLASETTVSDQLVKFNLPTD